MGTNYYAEREYVEGHGAVVSVEHERLHIGKSSGGWCFSLHVIPEEGINDLWQWFDYIMRNDCTIVDEYGDLVTLDELASIITKRKGRSSVSEMRNSPSYKQLYGNSYTSLGDYLDLMHAVEGPNNLLRHKIDGRHCVGHGEGTWDLIAGEFS